MGIMSQDVAVQELHLSSPAFLEQQSIPAKYTAEGLDISPPLRWAPAPKGTKSFVLIVDDPDAPDPKAPKMTWVHWVLYNIPAGCTSLPEGGRPLPVGTRQGENDWARVGYGGPNPPVGRHRYFFKIYALDKMLPDLDTPKKNQLETAMKGHVISSTQLIGTYEKVRGHVQKSH